MITRPQLPPRVGYVEVEKDGVRVYAPTKETKAKLSLKDENTLLKAQLKSQSDRADFIEDCIAEMATVLYG